MHPRLCYLLHKITSCKNLYIGQAGIRLADRFREHLGKVERNEVSNEPSHYYILTFLHHGDKESHKSLEHKFIFQIGTLNTKGIKGRLYSTNLFLFSLSVLMPPPIA